MNHWMMSCIIILFVLCWGASGYSTEADTVREISLLRDFHRVTVKPHSFAAWLRDLPLKTTDNQVYLYDGSLKARQNVHYRVIAMDVGNRDLQQCADAIIRLRAEYFYSRRAYDQIAFNFTSGDRASFLHWAEGYRPVVNGNQVSWKKRASRDNSYENFRKYLETVFMYAGSYSLSFELQPVPSVDDIKIGDVFIQGGFPGHAILVIDIAVSEQTGQTAVMLAQSYMPAQEIHILQNPKSFRKTPWYIVGTADRLYTPEWTFDWTNLKRFADTQ